MYDVNILGYLIFRVSLVYDNEAVCRLCTTTMYMFNRLCTVHNLYSSRLCTTKTITITHVVCARHQVPHICLYCDDGYIFVYMITVIIVYIDIIVASVRLNISPVCR